MIVLVHAVDAKGLPRCPTRRRASCLGLGLDAVVIHEPLGPALVDRRRRRRRRLGRAALLCRGTHSIFFLLLARLRFGDGVARLVGRPLALGVRRGLVVRCRGQHRLYRAGALGLGGGTSGFFRRLRGLRGCVVVLLRSFAGFFACCFLRITALLFGHLCWLHLCGLDAVPGVTTLLARAVEALHYSLSNCLRCLTRQNCELES